MKKIILTTFLLFFLLFLAPNRLEAACPTSGLVPCGTAGCPCQLCHLAVLFQNIIKFVFVIVIVIAIFMFTLAGFMFLVGGENPGLIHQAKQIISAVAFGLIIMFAAWLIVNTILTFSGLINPNFGWDPTKWFQVNCPLTP